MYNNAFETLQAPTNYNTRDISRHIQLLLAEGQTRDITEPCRLALLSPAERLYDELLTLRGSDYDAPVDAQQQTLLTHVARKLTDTAIDPFSFAVAVGWLPALVKATGGDKQPSKTNLKKTAAAAKDPWLLQGLAALCTRVAILAETQDTAHVVSAWQEAMDWWQKFFAIASVENTYAYAMQTEDTARQQCAAAWQGFRSRLVQALYTRCTVDYVAQNKGTVISACLNALNSPSLRLLEPDIYEQAVKAIEPSIAAGLMKSSNLGEAFNLWAGLPEFFKNKPSILSKLFTAMSTETANIDKGHGDYNAIAKVWDALDGNTLKNSTDIEIKAAMQKYYEAVSLIARNAVSDESKEIKAPKQKASKTLLTHLPKDYTVAKDASGEIITPNMLLTMIASAELMEEMEGILDCPTAKAEQKGATLWGKILAATPGENEKGEIRKNLTTAVLLKLRERGDDAFMLAFLKAFPKNQTIKSEDFNTIQDFLDSPRGGGEVPAALLLLKQFADGDVTYSHLSAILSNLNAEMRTARQADSKMGEMFEMVLKTKLVECVNRYSSGGNAVAQSLGLQIIGLLPADASLPGTDGSMSLAEVKIMLTISPAERARFAHFMQENRYETPKKSNGARKFAFVLLFECLSILPYAIPYWLGAISRVNIILFLITTIVAYFVSMMLTATVDIHPSTNRLPSVSLMPFEFGRPPVMALAMMGPPLAFFISTTI